MFVAVEKRRMGHRAFSRENYPTQANTGLEWGTRPFGSLRLSALAPVSHLADEDPSASLRAGSARGGPDEPGFYRAPCGEAVGGLLRCVLPILAAMSLWQPFVHSKT